MEKIVINPDRIKGENVIKKRKSRALLFNGNNNLLVENYNGIYILPGGKLEENETPKKGLIRELNEEIGSSPNEDDLELITTIDLYQKDCSSKESFQDRVTTTYYYTGNLDIDINNLNQNISKNEKEINLKFEYISIDKLEEILLKSSNNSKEKFFNN